LAGCYIGAFINGLSDTSTFETLIGKNLAVNMWFINWDTDFPSADCDTVNSYGGLPIITWEPYLSIANTLEAISNGDYDEYITDFAQDAKSWGNPVYLRFAHEMNGNWYGWDGYHNGEASGPAKYIAAWRHVYNIFSQEAVSNVSWVWSPNHKSVPDESWNEAEDYYPGDDYVDWIAIDGYNWGQGNWESFDQIFSSAYSTFSAYDKPLMIGEFACATDEVQSKTEWITDALSQIQNNYQQIRIFVWFSMKKERDWQVNSSSSSLNAFKNAIDEDYFKENTPNF